MTWTKLSDDFGDDCWTLSDAAFRLHVEGLGWSNRKLLDCRIPKEEVRRFAKEPASVAELLEAGFWIAEGAHYIVRHHAGYQRTREAVLKQQATNCTNGQRGGRPPKKPKPETETETRSETETETEPVSGQEREDTDPHPFPQVKTESVSESETETDGTGIDKKTTKGGDGVEVGSNPFMDAVDAHARDPQWRRSA